jgi:hypothetical protein
MMQRRVMPEQMMKGVCFATHSAAFSTVAIAFCLVV